MAEQEFPLDPLGLCSERDSSPIQTIIDRPTIHHRREYPFRITALGRHLLSWLLTGISFPDFRRSEMNGFPLEGLFHLPLKGTNTDMPGRGGGDYSRRSEPAESGSGRISE
jgi:hypothetical protein